MVIETRSVPPFQKNGYVVACETTGEAIVIDPGDEVHALLEIIETRSFAVRSILLTHAHIDHVTGVGPARKALDVLPERDRNALLMREEGLDYNEIAEALDLSVGSVGTTLARARRRLVEAFEASQHKGAGAHDVAG